MMAGAFPFANAAGVFPEHHVKSPVKPIFHPPLSPHGVRETPRIGQDRVHKNLNDRVQRLSRRQYTPVANVRAKISLKMAQKRVAISRNHLFLLELAIGFEPTTG